MTEQAEELSERSRFYHLLQEVTTRLVGAQAAELDAAVDDCLEKLGKHFRVDQVGLGQWSKSGEILPSLRTWGPSRGPPSAPRSALVCRAQACSSSPAPAAISSKPLLSACTTSNPSLLAMVSNRTSGGCVEASMSNRKVSYRRERVKRSMSLLVLQTVLNRSSFRFSWS